MAAGADHAGKPTRTGLIWPLSQGARAEGVAQRISRAIQLGLLSNGEQLPAEAEFAGQMGVSPMTLREALSLLREQGLVETRRGRTGGTFVRRLSEPPLDALRARLAEMTVTEIRELADAQLAIEGAAALLAAERAPQMTVRRLFSLVDQLEAAANRGDLIRADSRFHIEVAIASQSERLLQLAVDLQTETADLLTLPAGPQRSGYDWAAAASDHRAIAQAIAAGDATRARAVAEQHIHRNLAYLIDVHHAVTGPMTPSPSEPAADAGAQDGHALSTASLAAQVREHLESFFGSVVAVSQKFYDILDTCSAQGEPLNATALSGIHTVVREQLGRQSVADGFGVVLAPGILPDHDRYVEWLHRAGDRIAPIRLNLDTSSVDVYDYVEMDWYAIPQETGSRSVYGPFLDFSGVEYQVATITVPLIRGGLFYGVAGMDIRMSEFEPELMRIVDLVPIDAVLVNAERNVLASNTPRWVVGSRLPELPTVGADFSDVQPIGADSGWVLACAPES